MVFIENLDERDDWQSLSAIGKPLDGAVQAKLSGRDDEAKLLLIQAKVAAMTSPDLTLRDAKRVVKAIDAYYNDGGAVQETVADLQRGVRPETVGADGTEGSLHLARAVERISIQEADSLPELSYESLF